MSAFINTLSKLFLSGFLIIAICVSIGASCVLYSAIETFCERAKSKILKDSVGSYIFANIIAVGAIIILVGVATSIANSGYRAGGDGERTILVLLLLLWFGCLIYSIILRYRIYKEVAYITNQPLFLMAFWLGVTIFLLPIAVIVYIIAWIMVKDIRESMSAGEYENKAVESNTDSVKWF